MKGWGGDGCFGAGADCNHLAPVWGELLRVSKTEFLSLWVNLIFFLRPAHSGVNVFTTGQSTLAWFLMPSQVDSWDGV